MKKTLFAILLCSFAWSLQAQDNFVQQLIANVSALGGTSVVETESGSYSRIRMADSCYIEVLNYSDSILLVQTVCAPVCSSLARVYNKEWQIIREVYPPQECIFPFATIQDGRIMWKDNTGEILDEEEKKRL